MLIRSKCAVWGENMNVHDCTFSSSTMSSGKPGPNVACELHGAHNYFRNVRRPAIALLLAAALQHTHRSRNDAAARQRALQK